MKAQTALAPWIAPPRARWYRLTPILIASAFLFHWVVPGAAAKKPFELRVIPAQARTVGAEIADFDGDGRSDLLQINFDGVPPTDKRLLRIFFQARDGSIGPEPQMVVPLPAGGAAYELVDVLPAPGVELVVLVREGVVIVSFSGRKLALREANLPDGVTIGAEADDRGIDPIELVSFGLGPEPRLIIPSPGETFLLSLTGELVARLRVGGRANYFVQPPGIIYAESDIQLFFDVPRISVGDIDGDGRADLLGSSRHELRVFLQRPDGGFPNAPDETLPLARISLSDHMRGSGTVRGEGQDIDGDGLMDLLVSETGGGIGSSRSLTSIFLNRGGGWDLEQADAVLSKTAAVGGDQLIDLDGDGRLELLQGTVPISVLEIIEVFLTRALDVQIVGYELAVDRPEAGSAEKLAPTLELRRLFERKLNLPLNFETSRFQGFLPTFEHDVNGDGKRDFIHSTNGKGLEISLGGGRSPYLKRDGRQSLDTEGVLRPGDLNGDGLVDFVLYNPRHLDTPIQLLTNRGILPGTGPGLSARP